MRNLKKFLALALAMVMAFSLMLTVNAANPVKTFDDAGDITEEFVEAADVLTGMKVFQGDEGGFRPGDTITRAEVAALIYRLATGDTSDSRKDLYKDYGNFADVTSTDWFAGYVGYCANAGYIKGHGGYFNPYDSVTGYEALAMVLRAVGYDKNHEFEGATWQTNVSALSTQLGILDDVKSTHYGDRLYEPSRRDVVASLLFRTAAYVNMVEYTPMAGYNKFENIVDNDLRPTLGMKNFGLTWETGIVVGNQDTGEKWTKLGIDINAQGYRTDNGDYEYVSSTVDRNITLSFNTKTGIDQFGHKYKIWYDYNSDSGSLTEGGFTKVDNEFKTVYATFDKATLAAYVYAGNTYLSGNGDDNKLGSAAKAAGFASTSKALWSDRFGRVVTEDKFTNAEAADVTAGDGVGITTEIAKGRAYIPGYDANGNGTVDAGDIADRKIGPSSVKTYYLVSNNEDKTVDVVVPATLEVAEIGKKDTTANTKTLTLGADNKGGNKSIMGKGQNGELRVSELTEGSVQDLGALVHATEIVGTAKERPNRVDRDYVYKLENMPSSVEASIVASAKDDHTGKNVAAMAAHVTEITLSDGTVLKRSGITQGYGADDTAYVNGADDSEGLVGRLVRNALIELNENNTIYNENLTIYKDKTGRFVGVSRSNDFQFIYGTFGDYQVGDLGTGTIDYAITGVNWEGEKVINHKVVSIGAVNKDDSNFYTFRGVGTDTPIATAYGANWLLNITKKQLGAAGTGNEIKPGVNTGYIIDTAGNLRNDYAIKADSDFNGTMGADTIPSTTSTLDQPLRLNADSKVFARAVSTDNDEWNVSAADAANGFADVSDAQDGTLMVTDETKFIVVSGHGTSDLDVKVYTGLTEFLGGSTYVELDTSSDAGHTYYLTRADRYNNMNTDRNDIVDRVIMTASNLTGRNTSALYFSNSDKITGTMLNGEYYQYVLYNDGAKGYYFIESVDGTEIDPGTDDLAEDVFYTLRQTRTVNGQPVYAAELVDVATSTVAGDAIRGDNGICWSSTGADSNGDIAYTYVSTSNLSSCRLDDGTDAATYRVDNAKVVDLTGTNNHAEFKSILDLNNAISSGWTIDDVAVVNNGVNISVIYVLDANP